MSEARETGAPPGSEAEPPTGTLTPGGAAATNGGRPAGGPAERPSAAVAAGGGADEAPRVREMRWWDLDAVLAIEGELFPEDAWSPGMFWSELAHARGAGASRHYVVAEDATGRLVGYAGLAAVDGTGDVQTIAVAPSHWGTGLGARLLSDLLTAATAFECHEVLLEVRVDNARAQRLYERFGFEPIGFRRGYYQPGNVDALVMRLSGPAAPATHAAPPDDGADDPVDAADVTDAADTAGMDAGVTDVAGVTDPADPIAGDAFGSATEQPPEHAPERAPETAPRAARETETGTHG